LPGVLPYCPFELFDRCLGGFRALLPDFIDVGEYSFDVLLQPVPALFNRPRGYRDHDSEYWNENRQ
jgi:hypothetical protein